MSEATPPSFDAGLSSPTSGRRTTSSNAVEPESSGELRRGHLHALDVLEQLAPRRWRDGELPTRDDVEKLTERAEDRVQRIMTRCAKVDVFVAAQMEVTSTTDDVEAVYADFQQFCRWFAYLDDPRVRRGRPTEYFESLGRAGRRLVQAETLLARQLQQWLVFLRSRQGADSALRLFLTQVSAWHAYVHPELQQRLEAIDHLASPSAAGSAAVPDDIPGLDPVVELELRIDELIAADEIELLPAFDALMRIERDLLEGHLAVVAEPSADDSRSRRLVTVLWSVADLVLAEDARCGDRRLAKALGRAPGPVGEGFRLLSELLDDPEPNLLSSSLARRLRSPDVPDLVWRSLVIAHSSGAVRQAAARQAPLDALWQILAYPRSPIHALVAVAEQVAARGDDDLRKVLYDCVKSRIFATVAEAGERAEMAALEPFILLFFQFNFFIQTRYFEQLETMLHLYRAQARRFGLGVEVFDRPWRRLEVSRHRAGDPEATEPKGLERLPLPIQRHLAREGSYLTYFACHPNHLIAREVVPYVTADNLSRFLRLADLNRQMLEEAVRRLDLGTRRALVLEVLTHPRCPMIFAGRHLPQLRRDEVHRVIQSRSTHSEVKRKAMLLAIQKKGGGPRP
ncbi:MAG: hypothetical protein AAGD06_13295 [Acidobacteriota bacterium]